MIGIVSGAGCASLALFQRGLNISGLTTAAVSFVTGGEAIQGIAELWQNPDGTPQEKASLIGITTLMGVTTGVITNKMVETLCPQYSIARAFGVIVLGAVTSHVSMSNTVPHFVGALLGTAGRSALWAGAILFGASGIHALR